MVLRTILSHSSGRQKRMYLDSVHTSSGTVLWKRLPIELFEIRYERLIIVLKMIFFC